MKARSSRTLQMDKIREGIFWASSQLYGMTWNEIHDVPVVQTDVRVWKVTHPDGSLMGLWYFDPYAREGKSSGAWMNEYPHAGEVQEGRQADRLQQLQLREGKARRRGPDLLGRRHHDVPRVRPCHPRPELRRELSHAGRHQRGPRLRGIPPRSSTRTGCRRRKCSTSSRYIIRPARRCRPSWWPRSPRPAPSTRASTRSSISPPR